jgi:hypothetical protein
MNNNNNIINDGRTAGTDVSNLGDYGTMTPDSYECRRNNTLLNDNGTYRCKMLRYQHNQGR